MPSIRTVLRRNRRALTPRERRNAAVAVADAVTTRLRWIRARRVAFYMANDAELDPQPLMTAAASARKRCYLPVMVDRMMPWRAAPLAFQAHDPASGTLVTNRFGILEPAFDPAAIAPCHMLDIIFMPLVGFDGAGHRIGMGQGFYDRTLAALRHRFRRPALVGLAYAVQEMPRIEPNPWDMALDAVVTERGWKTVRA